MPELESSKAKTGLKLFAVALTGFAIGLGYVSFDADMRKKVILSVPSASSLFDQIDNLVGRANTEKNNLLNSKKEIVHARTEPTKQAPVQPAEVKVAVDKIAPIKPETKPTPVVAPVVKVDKPATVKTATKEEPVKVVNTELAPETKPPLDEPKQQLDWKETLLRHELQEEATVDGL